MPITYKPLFKLLIDKGMRKGELQEQAHLTATIMARLGKDQIVKTDALARICMALDCQPGDIMAYEPSEEDLTYWERYRKMQADIKDADTLTEAVEKAKQAIALEPKIYKRKH